MRSSGFLVALIAFAGAQPVLAQQPAKPPTADASNELHAQMTAFGKWLVRLNVATAEATQALASIQAEWQEARRSGSTPAAGAARFRPMLAQARVKVDEAMGRVRLFDTPEFPLLELDGDVTPPAVLRQTLELLDRSNDLIDAIDKLLVTTIAGDEKAMKAAVAEMLGAGGLLLATKAIMAEARAATFDKDLATHDLQLLEARSFRSASRAVGAFGRIAYEKPDPGAGQEFGVFADAMLAIIERGRTRIDAEIARWEAGAEAKESGSAAARVYRKNAEVLRVDRAIFEAALPYANALKAATGKARTAPLTAADLRQILDHFYRLRDEIIRVSEAKVRVLAAE